MSDAPVDLRLSGRSEDGADLEFNDDNGKRYAVRISDALRSTINQEPKARLSAVVSYEEKPNFTVKDIQARLRGGESIDSISRTTDWSVEKIEKFAGPILQERAYIIELALKSMMKRDGKASTLEEVAFSQLTTHGVDMDEVEWNTHRNQDGVWLVTLHYPSRDGESSANWDFDSNNRALTPNDDSARWIAGEAKPTRTTPSHGILYPSQTPAPRLVAVREEVEIIKVVQELADDFAENLELEIADESDPVDDGIVSRPKLPSWDDIMFGGSKSEDE